MSRLDRWPLPFNVITGFQFVSLMTLLGWIHLLGTHSSNLNNPVFSVVKIIMQPPQLWGALIMALFVASLLSLLRLPWLSCQARFTFKVVMMGLTGAFWVFACISYTISVGLTIGSFYYAGLVLAGIYEMLRTHRQEF